MKQIEEPARTIPVLAETDVLVVGSGPAGLAAALAASRMDVETMLVERFGCFGGNTTHAMQDDISCRTVDVRGVQKDLENQGVRIK